MNTTPKKQVNLLSKRKALTVQKFTPLIAIGLICLMAAPALASDNTLPTYPQTSLTATPNEDFYILCGDPAAVPVDDLELLLEQSSDFDVMSDPECVVENFQVEVLEECGTPVGVEHPGVMLLEANSADCQVLLEDQLAAKVTQRERRDWFEGADALKVIRTVGAARLIADLMPEDSGMRTFAEAEAEIEQREQQRQAPARVSVSVGTPTGAPAPASVEVWRPLVASYFAPSDVERALNVIACESSGDPDAKNPRSSASGLFQHLGRFWPERSVKAGVPGANIFDPVANVQVAAWLVYEGGGWSHWNPSRHCWG